MSEEMAPPSSTLGKTFLAAVDRVLYPITLGYTFVIFGFTLYEFWRGGLFQPRYPIGDVYLTLLTAYAAQREGVKWLGADEATLRIRRGELFVGLWFAVFIVLWAIANLSVRFALPQELKTITLGVLGIFVATGVSSGLRRRTGASANRAPGDVDKRGVLLRLLQERGPISAEDAAQALGISKPTAWRLLEALEKEGQITQDASDNLRERLYRRVAGS